MLEAIITLTPEQANLQGLRDLLLEAVALGVSPTTGLLDGGHIHVKGEGNQPLLAFGNDLAALQRFVGAYKELPGETEIVYGSDLALDLVVLSVSKISCGEHVGSMPENVIVTVNPACAECGD